MLRTLLASLCLSALALPAAAGEFQVLPDRIDGVAPKAMMHAYLLQAVRQAAERRRVEYDKVKTPEQIAQYRERLRRFFIEQLGGFPERSPLEPKVVGKLDGEGYRVEKVIYQSRPGHDVTAALYLPRSKPPYPGVLVPCGHSENGKAMDTYQRACILLARNGLAALCYDPIDQGERCQLLGPKGKPLVRGTVAHSLLGVGSVLLGRNTASCRIWDGMRSLDYLAGRPEIDPKRLGCTGNSGGGTLTSYLMALDDRIQAAAPSCYLTTFERLVETIGPQDAEQNIHGQIGFGMDHADYVLMRAPRPTLLCAATGDYFDVRGVWETFRQAKRWYARLGFAERVDLVETDAAHGFSSPLRVGAVRWMRRWLLGVDDAIVEPDGPVFSDRQLQCTPAGQVMLLAGARSVYDFNRDKEQELAAARRKLWADRGVKKALAEVRRITGIRKLDELPEVQPEKVGSLSRQGYRVDKLLLRPEPAVWLPALAFVPPKHNREAILYLHAAGKQADAALGGPIETLVRQGHLVLAVDLRGLGETRAEGKDDITPYLGPEWADVSLAYLLGKSYLAMRTEDTLICARLLTRYQSGDKPNRVHLVAIGRVGPAALHAAALEPGLFASVTLKQCLGSWSDVVRTPLARNQWTSAVHGALTVYDLPDLVASLPKEKITLVEPLDATEQPTPGK